MGIDQSVLLLREGNDLDQTEVFSELEQYSKRGSPYGKWNTKTSEDFMVRDCDFEFLFSFLIAKMIISIFRMPELYWLAMLEHQRLVSMQ